MKDFLLNNLDFVFVVLHLIIFIADIVRSVIHNRSIKKICSNCFRPVLDGEKHDCSDEDILALLSAAIKKKDENK